MCVVCFVRVVAFGVADGLVRFPSTCGTVTLQYFVPKSID